jgi:hypothetical protein
VTPVIYIYLDELQGWLGRRTKRAAGHEAAPLPAPAD